MQEKKPAAEFADFSQRWTRHLREDAKKTTHHPCPFCDDRKVHGSEDDLLHHVLKSHEDQAAGQTGTLSDIKKYLQAKIRSLNQNNSDEGASKSKRPLSTPVTGEVQQLQALSLESTDGSRTKDVSPVGQQDLPRKRHAVIGETGSPSSSMLARESESPPPRRPRTSGQSENKPINSQQSSPGPGELARPAPANKRLWNPDVDATNRQGGSPGSSKQRLPANRGRGDRRPQQSAPIATKSQSGAQPGTFPASILTAKNVAAQGSVPRIEPQLKQPETRPISQEQLVAEVKGIYAGLVMVEAKCIEVDTKQAAQYKDSKLNNEQWQALIALHRTLLHEHHDFFLASQHPSASPALRKLASKYAMPARMWRHGIHSFLELLRHRLPLSLDHMLAFIYLAYSMMALLYETVPAFEDTWIECLGDLGRYRMAIEDDDVRDREIWTNVARHWYSKASDKSPATGRLYHHLAILARPNALQQLFFYTKSLSVAQPFPSAKESIMTLFEPVLNPKPQPAQLQHRFHTIEVEYIKVHAMLFTHADVEKYDAAVSQFTNMLDAHIGRSTRNFMQQGYHMAVANSVALLGYGANDSILAKAQEEDPEPIRGAALERAQWTFDNAKKLHHQTADIVFQRIGDPNVLPFAHVTLAFLYHISRSPAAMSLVAALFPWESLVYFLNTLRAPSDSDPDLESECFPIPDTKDDVRPFPEDFALHGLSWTRGYFPKEWFNNPKIQDEEKYLEVASMADERKERIRWLGRRLAVNANEWIGFDETERRFFEVVDEAAEEMDVDAEREGSVASGTTVGPHGSQAGDESQPEGTATWDEELSQTTMQDDAQPMTPDAGKDEEEASSLTGDISEEKMDEGHSTDNQP